MRGGTGVALIRQERNNTLRDSARLPAARKRLLFISNHPDFWSHRLPLAVAARDQGWSVIVAAPGATRDPRFEEHRFQPADLPPAHAGPGIATVGRTVLRIDRLIREFRPDLIHVITLKYGFMAGLAARRHAGVTIVYTISGLGYLFSSEGLRPRLLRAVVSPCLRLALGHCRGRFIFQNPDDRALLIRRGFAAIERSALIRGSGVDLSVFRYVPETETDVPRVVMVTRLLRDKGISVFVSAARLLRSRGVKAHFQIAGSLDWYNPHAITEAEMRELVADGSAEWLGRVDDVAGLYAESAVVAYPSWYGEGVPRVLLEAAAVGRPIVTTDHPGCREVVADGINGVLVPIKDAVALAHAIERLLADARQRQRMGRAGRLRAEREFDVRLIAQQTMAVYDAAVAQA